MKRRRLLYIGGGFLAMAVLLTIVVVLTARSQWFRDQVRDRIVYEVERATGGEVEIKSFRFDWRALTAHVDGFVIHGTEPADAPPLFRAGRISVQLKIISVLRRMVDIAALDVVKPEIHLILNADGTTNVPEPKIKRPRDRTAMETILDLAVRRFSVEDGVLEVTSRGKTPFHGRGENLRAQFFYDLAGPRYRGTVSMQPLDFQFGENRSIPIDLDLALVLEKNRIEVERARLESGGSNVTLSGAIENLADPSGSFRYDLRLALAELRKHLRQAPPEGVINLAGNVTFAGTEDYKVTGKLNASNVNYAAGSFALRNFDAVGALTVTPERAHLGAARVSGVIRAGSDVQPMKVSGQVASVTLRDSNLELEGIRMAALGGTFTGNAQVRNFDRFRVAGNLSGLHARTAAGLVSRQELPWDSTVSGPVTVEGNLRGRRELTASARLDLAAAGEGPPVTGTIDARYDSRRGILDLGHSRLNLPGTVAEFSGSIGETLHVHVETRDFDDLVPLLNLGVSGAPRELPVSLRNGLVIFDGTVTGTLQNPMIAGRLSAKNLVYENRLIDFVSADLTASPSQVAARNGVVTRGALRAIFDASLGLERWRPQDSSVIMASAAMRQASLSELLELAGQPNAEVSGALSFDAKVTGTLANPIIAANLDAAKGVLYGEPFDRLTARVNYTPGRADIGSAVLTAGPKTIKAEAAFEHPRDSFRSGRLLFQIASNQMPLESIQNVIQRRPGVSGVLELAAGGAVEIDLRGNRRQVQFEDLKANIAARGLRMGEQSVGNMRLVASTEGNLLTAHLESDFADSIIKGDGQWRLAGNYPGSASIVFTRLNFGNLTDWLTSGPQRTRVAGFAEGTLKIEGPLRTPEQLQAVLEIPKIEVVPVTPSGMTSRLRGFRLVNAGPVRVSMANSVVRIEQARFTAPSTDIAVSGTVAVRQAQKTPLDVQAKGSIGLELLEMFDPDFYAEGTIGVDAAVRGSLQQPSIAGKLELKDASVNYAQFPNGLSEANGVIVFNGNRASIQTLTGSTGGGKVSVTGFVQIGRDPVFHLQATADDVRVRYPEGVSTLADASLNLTGTASRSLLSGDVTILRTGITLRSDFSSILARTAEPVRTPAARTGVLANMQLDIEVETAPDIALQTSLAQDLAAEAELRVRGTVLSPAVLGRINITQGEINFFGTKYTINQGAINFYNPVKIEPVLNIDLETKARGIDITLTVSGPINKLNVTPRSDPPLQFSEIIALLATGRAPTSDPTLAARNMAAQQSWQQMGATALVGQAIANPVAGRLQRFFGVSRLKIDPSFTGVENNPQARLTLEQQITRDITFTYITNVTNSNPQVVRVEWAFSRQWSVIAVRDENGLFGLDFLYKRRF
jgi:translocation and assembly module TamB